MPTCVKHRVGADHALPGDLVDLRAGGVADDPVPRFELHALHGLRHAALSLLLFRQQRQRRAAAETSHIRKCVPTTSGCGFVNCLRALPLFLLRHQRQRRAAASTNHIRLCMPTSSGCQDVGLWKPYSLLILQQQHVRRFAATCERRPLYCVRSNIMGRFMRENLPQGMFLDLRLDQSSAWSRYRRDTAWNAAPVGETEARRAGAAVCGDTLAARVLRDKHRRHLHVHAPRDGPCPRLRGAGRKCHIADRNASWRMFKSWSSAVRHTLPPSRMRCQAQRRW